VNLKAQHSCELVARSGTKPSLGLILEKKLPFLSAARSDVGMLGLALPSDTPRSLTDMRSMITGFYTLILNPAETEGKMGQMEKKMTLFQT